MGPHLSVHREGQRPGLRDGGGRKKGLGIEWEGKGGGDSLGTSRALTWVTGGQ